MKYHGEISLYIVKVFFFFFFYLTEHITMNDRQTCVCLFVSSCRLIHFFRYSSIVMHQLISVNAIILHVSNIEYKQYVSLQLYFSFLFHTCARTYIFFLFIYFPFFLFFFSFFYSTFYFDSMMKNRCCSILLAFIEIKYTRIGSI